MIRLWLSREQSIPMREQLTTQLLLGIVSQRIPAGERLPSVRELARRLHIHANTVSAAYRDLADRGWVKQRKGSGVYVRNVGAAAQSGGIDGFVRTWIEAAAAQGYPLAEIEAAMARLAQQPRAQQFLVADPDADLARIVALEISEALGYAVPFADLGTAAGRVNSETSLLVLPSHAARAQEEIPGAAQITVVVRSMDEFLRGYKRPGPAALIGMVSRSESIRRWSSTLLSALGFPPQAVLTRSPDASQWKRGLSACQLVAADVEAFRELPASVNGREMRIVSEEFLRDLAATSRQ